MRKSESSKWLVDRKDRKSKTKRLSLIMGKTRKSYKFESPLKA